jgi:hypothetical protein
MAIFAAVLAGDARGDVLGLVGHVFADIALHEAELVGQDEGLAVLPERQPPVLLQRMERHGEEAEFHILALYLIAWGLMGEPVPPGMIRGGPQKKNS